MKPLVIYHRADFDGLFSREIARRHFGTHADYLGWDYDDPVPTIEPGRPVYMIDISVAGLMQHTPLVWIDHHKSAMEKFSFPIAGLRIDGVAACRLAWQWFFGDGHAPKQAYVDREVHEPLAVQLAGEYDIWDRRDPRAELFQHALKTCDLAPHWATLLTPGEPGARLVGQLLEAGRAVQYARHQENESVIKAQGFDLDWEGLKFLALNTARCNSLTFSAALRPEHDGCFAFNWTGRDWRVSLYGVPGKPEIDFSAIAIRYGGGGHRQACGFRTATLPFIQPAPHAEFFGGKGSPAPVAEVPKLGRKRRATAPSPQLAALNSQPSTLNPQP